MERVTDIVKPFRVQLVHDADDRLIGVNIRAGDGAELDHDMVREATRSLLDHLKRDQLSAVKDARHERSAMLDSLAEAYQAGVTDEYLARLAVAYEELSANGYNRATTILASAIGGANTLPRPTVRTHVKRARDAGFLTQTTQGKGGGQATDQARALLEKLAAGNTET
ncbi:hypothetical protein OG976_04795 [Mycobacterium sp. NBC_00419]|uniref:hypothetical protein n=1 Tax=Mycobacterium sp. NBC_00419 TaxID=2975989 RepID=UPI002E1D8CA6